MANKIFDFSDLNGKVGVITGGAGIIGYAISEAMVSTGIKTAIIDIDREAAKIQPENFPLNLMQIVLGLKPMFSISNRSLMQRK
jgi:NAD(P)-dependent dehydrogenase (short-subunit alcohol dehydrogenase family)